MYPAVAAAAGRLQPRWGEAQSDGNRRRGEERRGERRGRGRARAPAPRPRGRSRFGRSQGQPRTIKPPHIRNIRCGRGSVEIGRRDCVLPIDPLHTHLNLAHLNLTCITIYNVLYLCVLSNTLFHQVLYNIHNVTINMNQPFNHIKNTDMIKHCVRAKQNEDLSHYNAVFLCAFRDSLSVTHTLEPG